ALDVPEGDVDRREREGEEPTGAGATCRPSQLRGYCLYAQRVLADNQLPEGIDSFLQGPRQRPAEEGQPDALYAVIGLDLNRDILPRVGAGRQPDNERV